MLHIDSRALGRDPAHLLTTGCLQKTTRGGKKRPVTMHKERAAVTVVFVTGSSCTECQSVTIDYCTDLEEKHKAHQDSSKNTHGSSSYRIFAFSGLLDFSFKAALLVGGQIGRALQKVS